MEHLVFEQIEEELHQMKLPNGLHVIIVPKKEYHKMFGIMTTPFGSIHNRLEHQTTGEIYDIPQGVAHFLEHKLFEDEQGEDVFAKFMEQGASANAFTSRRQTSYLFSASIGIKENLLTLLDFVQQPAFSKAGVEKEKGIIEQELHMYLDNPYFQIVQKLSQGLYPNHPAGHDIGGTVEAVMATTHEDLMIAYETFYHPEQMALVIVGNVNPSEIATIIRENQAAKTFGTANYREAAVPLIETPQPVITEKMEVSQPLIGYGVRLPLLSEQGRSLFKTQLIAELLLDVLFGPTSENYHRWYQAGWIDENFNVILNAKNPTHDWQFFGTTDFPQELFADFQRIIDVWETEPDLTEAHFSATKQAHQGDLLQNLNSMEYIATQLTESVFEDYNYFDVLELLQEITLEDLYAYARKYLTTEQTTQVTIAPISEK